MMLISLWSLDISLDRALDTLLKSHNLQSGIGTRVNERVNEVSEPMSARKTLRMKSSSCLINPHHVYADIPFFLSFFRVSPLVCCDRRFVCRCCLVSSLVPPPVSPFVCPCDRCFARWVSCMLVPSSAGGERLRGARRTPTSPPATFIPDVLKDLIRHEDSPRNPSHLPNPRPLTTSPVRLAKEPLVQGAATAP